MLFFSKKTKKQPESLKDILDQFKDLKDEFKLVSDDLRELKQKSKFSIQKVGMIRFNPFKEVGSDQSFSAAFLDDDDSGLVITSLYTREENRIYGKPIKKGLSEYQLSEEEQQAIEKAKLIQ